MNRYYLVQEVKDGKFVAYVATISESDNLLRLSQKYPDAFAVNACITKSKRKNCQENLMPNLRETATICMRQKNDSYIWKIRILKR